MALRLDGWLEETFESQLLLGNHWLQQRHERKKSGVKGERDRDWEGLYHDNGSCLDITNCIHPERNSALRILQAYCPKRPNVNSRSLLAVDQGHQVRALLQQLFDARARDDSRCLALAGETEVEDTMLGPSDESRPQDGDTSAHSQMPQTQVAFGTQIQHPIRARPDAHEPQVIGVNRLEPVLAGKTQRVDIQPGATHTNYEMLQLMLARVQNPRATKASAESSRAFVQESFGKRPSADDTAAAAHPPLEPPCTSPPRRNPQPRARPRTASNTLSSPKSGRRCSEDVSSIAPSSEKVARHVQPKDDEAEPDIPQEAATSAPECSWMKGFIFNSDTLKVPRLQEECLNKETSWLKPQPGVPPFQNGNMPQTILHTLHRLADEQATLRDEDNSDDESGIDPSPDSLPANVNLSAESVPPTTQDDDPSSSRSVSWSPSPEPPPVPVNVRQELPPDSSLEGHTSSAEQHPEAHPTSLASQPQQSDVIDISDNDAESELSPLDIPAPADSDDEMEMDEFVPQALGEDLAEKQSLHAKEPSAPSPKKPKTQSIVQVRETPYGKGKIADHMASTAPDGSTIQHGHDSSAESKRNSSTSVVHSTYDMPAAPSSAEIEQYHIEKAEKAGVVSEERSSNVQEKVEMADAPTENRHDHSSEDVQMVSQPLHTEQGVGTTVVGSGPQVPAALAGKIAPSVTSNTTTKPARVLHTETSSESSPVMPHVASSSTKRKLDVSPVKGNGRHSKRREIKIVGFGDATPVPIDLFAQLREDRETSLRTFREKRNSSTSFESQPKSTSKPTELASTEDMELDRVEALNDQVAPINRSPRHQSLYEEPSPRPTTVSASRALPEDSQPRKQPRLSQIQDPSIQNAQTPNTPAISNHDTPTTVFQAFKAAYPEYKGDTRHFQNQCKQMYLLDLEDKMVPKWQWDDFIIRNRTDYRDYAMACLDQGENAEPYYRFYKDNIRDTLYRRDVIESRRTLQQALEELGGGVEDAAAEVSRPRHSAVARKSLPGEFHAARMSARERIVASLSARPRHSLPVSSNNGHGREQHASTRTTLPFASRSRASEHRNSTSSTKHQAQQSDPDGQVKHSSGDPFRDYFFAIQRSTSWTGDDKIDPTKPWPANLHSRLSVQDAPRSKVDVLRWGDVLGGDGV
ncbi:telomerase holoenzyme est3 subunit [Stemphylium lycopersici]|nr:telomerase holoenzyme est3 subunit [Stemphylium lycopersici]